HSSHFALHDPLSGLARPRPAGAGRSAPLAVRPRAAAPFGREKSSSLTPVPSPGGRGAAEGQAVRREGRRRLSRRSGLHSALAAAPPTSFSRLASYAPSTSLSSAPRPPGEGTGVRVTGFRARRARSRET